MTGTTIAQAIPLAISPVLTRLYTPEDFGLFALFIALSSLFITIASGRYEFALLVSANKEETHNLFALGFLIITAVSTLLLITILIFHEPVLHLLNNQEIGPWLYFIPLAVFLTGFFNLLVYSHNQASQYKEIATASVVKAIILSAVQIAVAFTKPGVSGLISGQLIAQAAASLMLLKKLPQTRDALSTLSKESILKVARQYRDFPKFQAPHAFFNATSANMPVYLFSIFFTTTIIGFYALSTRIVFAPFMIISSSISKVYNQRVSELYRQGEDAYGMSLQLLRSLAVKMALPFIAIVLFSPEIFSFIFGAAWREAGEYTQILSLWLFLNILVSTVSFIPSLINQQKKAFIVSIIQLLLLALAITVGGIFDNVHLSLWLYTITNAMVLLYNLQWMLKGLKVKKDLYQQESIKR